MRKIFVDTVAWIALINLRDSLRERTKRAFQGLRATDSQFVTSEFVLIELANSLSSPISRERCSVFIDGLRELEDVEIIPANSVLFALGFELYKSRPDKEWSLVDCTSFVSMENRDLDSALTEDRHFEQAGFMKLL